MTTSALTATQSRSGLFKTRTALLLLACGLLLAGCGSVAIERYRCGPKLVISIFPLGGVGLGGLEYYPRNKASWVRHVSVDDRYARLELTQKWAGRDDEGNPTSGERLTVRELDREAKILRIAFGELPVDSADLEWQEELPCKEMSEWEFRKLEFIATMQLFIT